MEEMSIKGDAPLFSRSTSPEREKKYVCSLADIPEAIPGPNAFAQQAARMEKHRLDGNAFYQQEIQRRRATPPTDIHPALRSRSHSDLQTPLRDSSCTTMSPFIGLGKEKKQDSPPLKLVPSNADLAVSTLRGGIEERQERIQREREGSLANRAPVLIPNPKLASANSTRPTAKIENQTETQPTQSDSSSKTPKKGFFGKLKLTTNIRATQSPAISPLGDFPNAEHPEPMPVKAQAILGASPSKKRGRTSLGSSTSRTSFPRSVSKRKGFFSRKTNDLGEVNDPSDSFPSSSAEDDKTPLTGTSITKILQTAISDPTHYSFQNNRVVSHSHSDKGTAKESGPQQCAVSRTQSLKYFDHSMPPTPPAKNTPPDEKTKKENALAKASLRLPFHDERAAQPKHHEGIVSMSGRISPTRFGSYGHKEVPVLVTKPSVYSLHASVVPNIADTSVFQEAIEGLGLDAFKTSPKNVPESRMSAVYSPSVYSSDWTERSNAVLDERSAETAETAKSPNGESTHTKESSSSGGEIPIFYPGLAKDPSVNNVPSLRGVQNHRRAQSDTLFEMRHPWHGCTHSLDHNRSNSPQLSINSGIFSHHVEDDKVERNYGSPTSFKHRSAAPSPLYLPTTVYTPSRKNGKSQLSKNEGQTSIAIETPAAKGVGIDNQAPGISSTPTKRNRIFDNAPDFSSRTSYTKDPTPSPQDSDTESNLRSRTDVDPQKPSPKKNPSTDKLDRMIAILDTLNARSSEMDSMREEMRATNERLDQRLAAVEHLRRASPAPSYVLDEAMRNEKVEGDANVIRIPTDVARSFYRRDAELESGTGDHASASDQADLDTITELKETNRKLLEMVGGFAQKIEALEKKAGGQF